MDAKKCDRCGTYYVDSESAVITLRRGAYNFARAMFGAKLNDQEKDFDLCDECVEEFKKWMNIDEKKTIEEPHGTE